MKSQLNLVKILFPYISSHKKVAIMASFFMIVVLLLALPTPYLMKFIIAESSYEKSQFNLNLKKMELSDIFMFA